jgi:H/ACA ribonucleoprotein complex subunit 3
MVWLIRKCINCSSYTLNKEKCPTCGGPVKIPHPAKFSLDDRYSKYKIRMKRISEESLKK